MAITKEKHDDDLFSKIEIYANENDKSKVIRLALKKFLSVSPIEKKDKSAK